jgi:predicted secreted hydrolase
MNVKFLFILCFFPLALMAQGFSGLGSDADEFANPLPNPVFQFPADHGPHPDYRFEWWYLTANLSGPNGKPYGLQWTLFRTALAPGEDEGWKSPQVWFAHAAITTPEKHMATERFARGGIGQAGVEAEPFHAWIDDWTMKGSDLNNLQLRASGPDFSYDMVLKTEGPLVFHGKDGYSVKSADGQASIYYSQPFFQITGTLRLPKGDVEVTGEAWLDREWSSQPLAETQLGWDWFSLTFKEGSKLMGFQLRQKDGETYSSATWIAPDGKTVSYSDGIFLAEPLVMSEVSDRTIPTEWWVSLPERGIGVKVTALNRQAWMDLSIPYWEGPVSFVGSHEGLGYLEMTGYE